MTDQQAKHLGLWFVVQMNTQQCACCHGTGWTRAGVITVLTNGEIVDGEENTRCMVCGGSGYVTKVYNVPPTLEPDGWAGDLVYQ